MQSLVKSLQKKCWSDDLRTSFGKAQDALRHPKTVTLPHPDDQLILISDACNSPPAVGSTLYVKRGENLLVAGFFSAKIGKHQLLWLPCEIEALGINLAISSFSNYIRESKHTTKFLTDSKACVQAFGKLSQGAFSLSPRISSFLMNLNAQNVSIEHISGSSITLTDFSSRNAISCPDKNCQVCQFVNDHVDLAVRSISVSDVERGAMSMPYYNVKAWKEAQKEDPELKRCYSQLSSGTRPGKKEKNLKVLRKYFQIATISDNGLLIHRKSNPYGRDFELIIVPSNIAQGLISALHLRFNHPCKTQFKKVWDRYFFALNSERLIEDCTRACSLCTSLQRIPKELFAQSTSQIPDTVGKVFSADVIRREKQMIFVLMDIFSSFVLAQLIPNEQQNTLRESLIQLSAPYKHPDGCIIRVDNASGFTALKQDQWLQNVGIALDFGRIKHKNQNPCVDRVIQDIENEIKRMSPDGKQISAGTLAIALSNTNSRIRSNGLSSEEVLLKRDVFSNSNIDFEDKQIQNFRYIKRLQNHPSSELSKSRGYSRATKAIISVGDIVHVKSEGTKHKARDFYLVSSVNYETNEVWIQKFCGNQLRNKKYLVRLEEIYLASANFISSNKSNEEEDDDIPLNNEIYDEPDDLTHNEVIYPEDLPRRSDRNRHQPDWLATSDIQRVNYS